MKKTIGITGIALLIGACYLALWPQQLGGPVSYVVTSGNSMEPDLHEGDLVIVRGSDDYSVGEVVAYINRSLGSPVLHRIIDVEGDSFVLQGDNNDFIDSYRPDATEILGRSWVTIPGGGVFLRTVASPEVATAIAVLLGLAIPGSLALRRRRRAPGAPPPTNGVTAEVVPPTGPYRRALVPLAVVLAVSGAFAGLSFGRAPFRDASEEVTYSHGGRFTYSGRSIAGDAIYENRRVRTGDPIYKDEVRDLRIAFAYSLDASPRTDISGTQGLEARVSSADGWNRTIELAEPISFDGPASVIQASLDLDAMTRLTHRMERQAGFDPGLYTVEVASPVTIQGTLEGAAIDDSFVPAMSFTMDDLKLQPAAGSSEGGPVGAVEEASGATTLTRRTQSEISLLGLDLPVKTVRWVSGLTLLFALMLGLVLLAGFVRASRRETEGEKILARFPDRFVPVRSFDNLADLPAVEMISIEDLIRLADASEKLILYVPESPVHTFLLEQGGVVYHYTIEGFSFGSTTDIEELRIEIVPAIEDAEPMRLDETIDAR